MREYGLYDVDTLEPYVERAGDWVRRLDDQKFEACLVDRWNGNVWEADCSGAVHKIHLANYEPILGRKPKR